MDKQMDYEIKNLLNQKDNLDVPEEISIGVDEVLKKINNAHTRRTWIKRASITATLVLASSLGLGVAFPAFAERVPGINRILGKKSVFSQIGENSKYLDNIKNVKDSSIAINKTSVDKGISVTMKEIAYDGTAIYVVYQVKGEAFIDKFRGIGNISINGKQHEFNSDTMIDMRAIDSKTLQVAQMYILSGQDKLDNRFNVSIEYIEMQWKSGSWKFDMTLDKKEMTKNSKHIELNKEVKLKSGKGIVQALNQSSTFVTLTVDYDKNSYEDTIDTFSIVCEDGTELKRFFDKTIDKGDKKEVVSVYKTSKDTNIKKIILNQSKFPCASPNKIKNKTYMQYNDKLPKTVSIGNGKIITIDKIEASALDLRGGTLFDKNIGKTYTVTITAKDISIQDYVNWGGITVYDKEMDEKNYNAYGGMIGVEVLGNNIYKLKLYGDSSKVESSKQVLAFAQYDDLLYQVDEIDIK